jgi:hypothetical protein
LIGLSQIGAEAHLKVKTKKMELQKEAYGLLKDMSIENACERITAFRTFVNDLIKTADEANESSPH